METGRLYDIDGDGRLDILPNGTDFAAWYELVADQDSGGKPLPRFIKHDLPQEVAGHGVGFGDIDGDGRGDIAGPRGFLAAPDDRRAGRWIWHAEFDLPKDASIPILVYDVDGDGDNDLAYGRGHRYGLYWLEQVKTRAGERDWTLHAIDTSWAQPHSLLLTDLDGDRQLELVAGKRYMGHEGRDPGEYERIQVFSYRFDPARRTFARQLLAADCAGFGLDPKAADIDADGDIDLIAADRNGLSLLVSAPPAPAATAAAAAADTSAADNQQLLDWNGNKIATAAAWAPRRASALADMQQVMGPLPTPDRRVPLDVKVESREETPDYLRIKLTYAAEPGDRVPALLFVPKSVPLAADSLQAAGKARKLPAMLCLHPTNVDGKAQTAGLVGLPTRHYGHQLAQLGFVCLIPDYPSFGEYKAYDFHQQAPGSDQPLYASGTMKAIWNNLRAVDLLETLGYVDRDNVGVIGHSLGGHNALFTAAFDPRLKAVVTSCGFTGFADYYGGNLTGWTSDRYMPRIRDVYGKDPARMPFDFYEVLSAIAPRAVFVAAPLADANFDNPGVRKVIAGVAPVYEMLGAKGNLRAIYPDCQHDFPDAVRAEVYDWLKQQLK
jgi:predicted dienelactone hydrolase